MAYIPVCDKHLGKGKTDAAACVPYGGSDPGNIDAVREVTAALEDESDDWEDHLRMLDRDAESYEDELPIISPEDSWEADASGSHQFTSKKKAALEDLPGDEGKLARAGFYYDEDNSPPWGQSWVRKNPRVGEHYIVHSGPREKGRYQHVFYPETGNDRDEIRSSHDTVESALRRVQAIDRLPAVLEFDVRKESPYWSGRGESRPWKKPVPKEQWPTDRGMFQSFNSISNRGWRRLSG